MREVYFLMLGMVIGGWSVHVAGIITAHLDRKKKRLLAAKMEKAWKDQLSGSPFSGYDIYVTDSAPKDTILFGTKDLVDKIKEFDARPRPFFVMDEQVKGRITNLKDPDADV